MIVNDSIVQEIQAKQRLGTHWITLACLYEEIANPICSKRKLNAYFYVIDSFNHGPTQWDDDEKKIVSKFRTFIELLMKQQGISFSYQRRKSGPCRTAFQLSVQPVPSNSMDCAFYALAAIE
eukprot:201236_1